MLLFVYCCWCGGCCGYDCVGVVVGGGSAVVAAVPDDVDVVQP